MVEKFGVNAGIIWSLLNETGRQNLKDVKKATKFTDKKLYSALGWLAREGKINIEVEEKEIFVSLS